MVAFPALFSSDSLMPHGFCYQWDPFLIWLHGLSDTLIAIAYFSIPLSLIYLARKKRNVIPFDWMFVCFGVFIAACGATHLMEVVTLWFPHYWFSGAVKVVTALASLPTAILLTRVVPQVLELPSPRDMELANQELRESEDRYRDLVEHSHDLICTHDLQGRLLSVNELPAKILGYSREELIHKPMKSLLLPEHQAGFDEYLATIQSAGHAKGTLVVLTKNGERRIWEYHNTLRTDGVSAPVVRGIAHDVTEQRIAERSLRKSEERFRLMADNIEEIFWLLDPKSLEVVYVSPAFEHICERPMSFAYDDPLSYREIIHPEDAPRVLQQLASLEKTHEFHEQFRILVPSAEVKWVEVWGFTAKDTACNVTALVGTVQDITERKRAEEALRCSEELFHAAFDQVAVGFSMTDLQGRFLKVNEAYCRITGYSEQELLQTNYQAITHPQDLDENLRQTTSLIAGKSSSIVYHKRYIRKSGEPVWVQNSVSRLTDGEGKVTGFVALTEDITDRKRAEDGVRRLSGHLLQLQDEERRRIARDLHDTTGQDLVVVATTLGHMRTTIPAANRKMRKSLSQCEALANRCIREVRTLSYVLHPPMLDEAGLASAIRHFAAGYAERTGIEVHLDVQEDFGRLASEEEMALFRVMQESLVNIQRHSGSFTASIALHHTPKGVLLEMKDQGRGISANGHRQPPVGAPLAGGVGIQSMRERMKQVGGQLDTDAAAHQFVIVGHQDAKFAYRASHERAPGP